MITEAKFNGGATYSAAVANLHWGSTRIQSFGPTAGTPTGALPDTGSSLAVRFVGGPVFYVFNVGSVSLSLVDPVTAATYVIPSGQVGMFWLASNLAWRFRAKTFNTARTWNHGTVSAVTNPASRKSYDPFCFEGDDCELAQSQGLVPLDGEEGREKVIAPFFQDVVKNAKNASREAIRAADLVMPSVVPLRFTRDEFTPDPLHPLAATVLSNEFYEALYNNDRPHAVPYDETYTATVDLTSRHWHHVRWGGVFPLVDWFYGNGSDPITVVRKVWRKIVPYRVGETDYEMEIRFELEHLVSPEPNLDPEEDPGGQNERDFGAWGSLLNVYVFTDELSPSFGDGDTFTPTGASGPVEFSRDDPCAYGLAPGVGGNSTQKFCHPQLVICANVPTTFQSPMGYDWIPWEDRQYLKVFQGPYELRGKNRVHCYKWANGAPWTPGTCTADAPLGVGILGNVVFGWTVTTYNGGCMTLGGDFPKSRPPDYLTIENGLGTGQTYLQPTRPGWDEECGELDVENGSSASIHFCVDDQYGNDDGTGLRTWPGYEPTPCNGHPDEPFEGVGGSHTCFNNNGTSTATKCCIEIVTAVAGAREVCTTDIQNYGDFDGSGCELLDPECVSSGSFWKQVVMEVEDYSYLANGNQDARSFSFIRLLPDPDQIFYSYEYDSGTVGDFVQEVGTWVFNPTNINTTAINAGEAVRAVLLYNPSGNAYRDVKVSAVFQAVLSAGHGFVLSGSVSVGDDFTGYTAQIQPGGGDTGTVSIRKWNAGTPTTLATLSISNLVSDTVTASFEQWGTKLTFKWQIDGEAEETMEVDDCTYTTGCPGVCTVDGTAGAVYEEFKVIDNSTIFVEASAFIAKESVSLDFPAKMMTGWGQCNAVTINPDCGTPPNCNCSSSFSDMDRVTSASHSGGDISPEVSESVSGDNPTWCGGPFPASLRCNGALFCPGFAPRCRTCPPPWEALYFCLSRRCLPENEQESEAKMCRGISFWEYAPVFCD